MIVLSVNKTLLCFIVSSSSASALEYTVSKKNAMQIRTVGAFNSRVVQFAGNCV